MGREINRVPLDFAWPIGASFYEVGVSLPLCPNCRGGWSPRAAAMREQLNNDGHTFVDVYVLVNAQAAEEGWSVTCSACDGLGRLYPTPEVKAWADAQPELTLPEGDGWQLWETVGDSPMSPVFATADELVDWMTSNPWMMNPHGRGLVPSDRQTAERFVGAGWAPSMVTRGGSVVDGVTFVTRE